jgi:hypothetical protein
MIDEITQLIDQAIAESKRLRAVAIERDNPCALDLWTRLVTDLDALSVIAMQATKAHGEVASLAYLGSFAFDQSDGAPQEEQIAHRCSLLLYSKPCAVIVNPIVAHKMALRRHVKCAAAKDALGIMTAAGRVDVSADADMPESNYSLFGAA